MYGVFGGYTRWAVVFLIIFVLFFLLVPGYMGATGVAAGPGVAMAAYGHHHMHGGYNMMGAKYGAPYSGGGYGYESPSST